MAKIKMRVTYHNGRANKQGVYSAKHNDRNFDIQTAEHIKPSETEKNIYWHYYKESDPKLSFEQVEQKYYTEHFNNYLIERNKKSIKQGHKERVQSIEDYRKSQKSCPEETIFQVGNVNNNLVSKEELENIFKQYLEWQKENYPQIVTLNWAYHADEQGAGHIHARQVWLAHDSESGQEMVNQGKALREMAVPLPDPSKKEGRYNNAKMTYTQKSREKFAEICRENGVEIEDKPLEASKTGKDLTEWQTEQDKQKAEEAKADLQKAIEEQKEILTEITKAEIYLAELGDEAKREKKRADDLRDMADMESVRLSALDVVTDARERAIKDLEIKERDAKERIKKLEKEFENKKIYQKIEIDAQETYIKNKRGEIKAINKEIIKIEEQRQAIKDKINEGNDILDNIEADLDSIVAVVAEYQNKLINAHKTKNYKEELQIVKEFFSWYNPNGRRELEQFFDAIPKIAQNIQVKKPTKNNDNGRGWGWAR